MKLTWLLGLPVLAYGWTFSSASHTTPVHTGLAQLTTRDVKVPGSEKFIAGFIGGFYQSMEMSEAIQKCVNGTVEVFNHIEDGVEELRKESKSDMKNFHFKHIKNAVVNDFIPAVRESLDTIYACYHLMKGDMNKKWKQLKPWTKRFKMPTEELAALIAVRLPLNGFVIIANVKKTIHSYDDKQWLDTGFAIGEIISEVFGKPGMSLAMEDLHLA